MIVCDNCGSEEVVQLLRITNGVVVIDKYYCLNHKTVRKGVD